jgi:hypothetical protein
MSAPHSTIARLQGLVDDLIRTFDKRPAWQLKLVNGASTKGKSAADLITLLNGVETEGEEPIAQGDTFAITDDGFGILGIMFGLDNARYFTDLTNLLIRITDLLVPALEEARQRHVEILQTERDVAACNANQKSLLALHDAMRRAARAVLEAEPLRHLQPGATR